MPKVMSYNVSWCNQDKIDWLLGHDDIDVFVIPECGGRGTYMHPKGISILLGGRLCD